MKLTHRLLPSALPVLPVLLVAATAAAQRTVIVDAANGPGTNHTTLAAALADLRANDVIILRAGAYAGLGKTTNHSFVLLGEGSPLVQPGTLARATLELTLNGTQYQRVAIKGVRFESTTTGQWALSVRTPYNFWPAPTVEIEDCDVRSVSPLADRLALQCLTVGVTVQRSSLGTSQVFDCLASFSDCTIRGDDQSWYQNSSQRAQPALDVQRSQVWIVNSNLGAGNSNTVDGTPASCVGLSDSSLTTASRILVTGNCTLTADQSPSPVRPAPAVFMNYSSFYPLQPIVEREAGIVLVPAPRGLTFGPSIQQVVRAIPHLRATTAPRGGVLTCTVHGGAGDFAALLGAFSTFPSRSIGFPVLLDLSQLMLLGTTAIPAGLEAALPLPIPDDLALRGLVLQASAATISPALVLDMTNPVSGTIQ